MSKKELKNYLSGLNNEQLRDQVMDLYSRFKNVKEYYDFVFNPKEKQLLEDCKFRISKEYFPVNGRKAKGRRSVAQKFIRHFIRLGVDPVIVADIMLYNIEIAQVYSGEKDIKQESFYTSMLKSFVEAVAFINETGLCNEFRGRIEAISDKTVVQNWINKSGFERACPESL